MLQEFITLSVDLVDVSWHDCGFDEFGLSLSDEVASHLSYFMAEVEARRDRDGIENDLRSVGMDVHAPDWGAWAWSKGGDGVLTAVGHEQRRMASAKSHDDTNQDDEVVTGIKVTH